VQHVNQSRVRGAEVLSAGELSSGARTASGPPTVRPPNRSRRTHQGSKHADPWPGVETVLGFFATQPEQALCELVRHETSKTAALVVGSVPRHLCERRQRQRRQPFPASPGSGMVEEQPSQPLAGMTRGHGYLLDMTATANHVDQQIRDRAVALVDPDPCTVRLDVRPKHLKIEGLILRNGIHPDESKDLACLSFNFLQKGNVGRTSRPQNLVMGCRNRCHQGTVTPVSAWQSDTGPSVRGRPTSRRFGLSTGSHWSHSWVGGGSKGLSCCNPVRSSGRPPRSGAACG